MVDEKQSESEFRSELGTIEDDNTDNTDNNDNDDNIKLSKIKLTPKWAKILYVVLILSVVIGIMYCIFWLSGESKECVTDPLIYGIEKLDDNIKCSCHGNRYEFVFDESGIRKPDVMRNSNVINPINFSAV